MQIQNKLPWILAGCLLAMVIALFAINWNRAPQPEQLGQDRELFADDVKKVLALHTEKKWTDAVDRWDKLLASDSLAAHQRDEINRHRSIAVAEQVVGQIEWERSDNELSSKPLDMEDKDDFLKYYPEGKKIRSVGLFHINGRGENTRWVLNGVVNFAYQYNVNLETLVKQNTGDQVVFEVIFKDVNQVRAISEAQVQFRVPDIWN